MDFALLRSHAIVLFFAYVTLSFTNHTGRLQILVWQGTHLNVYTAEF